ncbi:MAG: beta-ketoacyl-ACP synthase II, partial [Firmicutes bacterium]|nr:beta-ketoacyl-ACP synthase II [Bacillota bacterium]
RRVVVTGMGAVSPVGVGVGTVWDSLVSGKNGIGKITAFDTSEYKTSVAAEVKDFNPRDFMERSDVLKSDRYAQFGIAASVEAVEDSGIIGKVEPERIAVYLGSGIGGIITHGEEYKKLMERGAKRISPYFIPMMIPNMAAGMVAIRYNCQGPAMPSVTACASGSNAIGEALRLIRHGYADAAITGGAEAPITPLAAAGFGNMQALSPADDPEEASLPFDARRRGFVMGEGSAVLVLEEMQHAIARGAKIYGEVTGYGSTCDAYHITAPRPDAKGGADAMKAALDESAYTVGDVVYVNAHGTGTPMNDKVETLAIKKSLGEDAARAAYISSTKSMTGHMLGAAGAIEALVCLKVLESGIIPPTINLNVPDPECDLNYVPNTAVKADITLALSNSLGFGGHNACLAFRKVTE